MTFHDQEIDSVPDDEKPIYWLQNGTYIPFKDEGYAHIANGKVKL